MLGTFASADDSGTARNLRGKTMNCAANPARKSIENDVPPSIGADDFDSPLLRMVFEAAQEAVQKRVPATRNHEDPGPPGRGRANRGGTRPSASQSGGGRLRGREGRLLRKADVARCEGRLRDGGCSTKGKLHRASWQPGPSRLLNSTVRFWPKLARAPTKNRTRVLWKSNIPYSESRYFGLVPFILMKIRGVSFLRVGY